MACFYCFWSSNCYLVLLQLPITLSFGLNVNFVMSRGNCFVYSKVFTIINQKSNSQLTTTLPHYNLLFLPQPSHGSFSQSLSPPGGAPGLTVHWRQWRQLLPLLATQSVVAELLLQPGLGRTAQTDLPMHWPLSAAVKNYWQPKTLKQEIR